MERIYNPDSGRFVNKYGTIGKKVLKKYTEAQINLLLNQHRGNNTPPVPLQKLIHVIEEDKLQEYQEKLVPFFFQMCQFKTHKYLNESPISLNMKKISDQINSLADEFTLINWSSGIFIAIDEERPYLFKFMIIGPVDTPYENGCFLFDVFLEDFPTNPPKVNFLTTDSGRISFNPNLYASGKVCLSLLGTWAGPGWDVNNSTILQIVVSIQSMIFVDNPFFNEPGYDINNPRLQEQSIQYNDKIKNSTTRVAIIETLKNVENEMYHPFNEIIKTHFKLKRNHIIETLQQWNIDTKSFEEISN